MHGTPLAKDQPFASKNLRELQLMGFYKRVSLGAFPKLRRMALIKTPASLQGINFPRLEMLIVENGAITLEGNFPSLRLVVLRRTKPRLRPSFNAPCLSEMSFTDVEDAHRVYVNKTELPELQKVTIMPRRDSDESIDPITETNIPVLSSGPIPSGSPLVTLTLGTGIPPEMVTELAAKVPHWQIYFVPTPIYNYFDEEWRF